MTSIWILPLLSHFTIDSVVVTVEIDGWEGWGNCGTSTRCTRFYRLHRVYLSICSGCSTYIHVKCCAIKTSHNFFLSRSVTCCVFPYSMNSRLLPFLGNGRFATISHPSGFRVFIYSAIFRYRIRSRQLLSKQKTQIGCGTLSSIPWISAQITGLYPGSWDT